jgi:hypothetical protein
MNPDPHFTRMLTDAEILQLTAEEARDRLQHFKELQARRDAGEDVAALLPAPIIGKAHPAGNRAERRAAKHRNRAIAATTKKLKEC